MTRKSINGTLDGRRNLAGDQRDFIRKYFTKITVKIYSSKTLQGAHIAHQEALERKHFAADPIPQYKYV